jgi:hypothetical protein
LWVLLASALAVVGQLAAAQHVNGAVPSPSAAAAAKPTTTLGGAACLRTINGQTWSPNCRPYAANSPWNVALPESPAQHTQFPTSIMSDAPAIDRVWIGPANASSDGSYPVFFASNRDPIWTVKCTQYCGNVPVSIHAPANIRVALGPDHHIAVVQRETGAEVDGWGCKIAASTVSCAAVNQDNFISGSGIENPSTTSGASLGVAVRTDEIARAIAIVDGVIPHVIPIVLACVSGAPVPPFGTSDATQCTSGTSVPIGTHIQYTKTFAQIDNTSGLSNYHKVMLRTLHRYGAVVMDTSGYPSLKAGGGFTIPWENPGPYSANGATNPAVAILGANGFRNDGAYSGYMIGPSFTTADPNFAAHLQIVAPCYAQGTCTL